MSFASLRRVLRTARKGLCSTCSKTKYPQLEAAGAGHVGCLIYTLETLGGVVKDEHDVTALHVAARKGQIAILIYIAENGIVRTVPRARNGASPAHDAAGTGNLDCLRYLLNRTKASPNDLDNNAATPLHWAVQNGHMQVVQWLVVDAMSRIDVKTRNGVTPLHLAAARNHLEVLRWLAAFVFRHYQRPMHLINAKDKNGTTPFYHAAQAGHLDIIRWLAEKGGGDPTIYSADGFAPLHAATLAGHLECVKYLFQFGTATAPGGLRTNEGSSALHLAATYDRLDIVNWLLEQKECTGMERDYYQCTPMHDAADAGNLKILKLLCENGVDCTATDVEHNTPMEMAQRARHHKCANYLRAQQKKILQKRNLISNSGPAPHARQHRLQRQRPTQAEMMDKFRHAPPHKHMAMSSVFDDDEEDGRDHIGLRESSARQMRSAIPQEELSEGTEWVTLHDLMDEEEIEELSQEDTEKSKAEQKRKEFEEKLEREAKERERKKLQAHQMMQEAEQEIRYRLEEELGEDTELVDVFESLETAVEEGHRELAAALVTNTGASSKKGMKKSDSEPRGLSRKEKAYSVPSTGADMERVSDDLENEGKKSQKWFSKLINRKTTSAPQMGISQSKSWDSLSTKTRSTSKDQLDKDGIPTPPPVPSPKFLLGKIPFAKKSSGMNLKEELLSSCGRDAYDDVDEEGSDEDRAELRQATRRPSNRIARSKVNPKQLSKKKRSAKVEDFRGIKGSAMIEGYKTSSPRVRKKLGEQRQLTPYPSNAPVYNIKSDLPVPKSLDFDSDDPVSPPPPPSPVQQTKSQQRQAAPAVLKPVRPAPLPPKTTSAPIAKAVSTRGKRALAPQSPTQQPNRPNQLNGAHAAPLAQPLFDALNRQKENPSNLAPRQFASQHFVLRRQTSTTEKAVEEEEQQSDSTDSFTDSSEEEEEDTESSDTGESSDEEDDSMVKATHVEAPSHISIPMRPIMAKNKAMFGARAARQAMMRMKAARYPRILRRQIIKLDTIEEDKFEKVHQTETEEEKADALHRILLQRRTLIYWKRHILELKTARRRAERLGQRKRRELIAKVFYGWVQARNEADVGGVKPKREAKEDKGLALKKIEQDRVSSLRQMLQERERERKAKQQREDEVLRKGVLARERERAEQERLEKIRKAKAEEERKLELQRAAQARKEEQITSRKKAAAKPKLPSMTKEQRHKYYLKWLNSQLVLIGLPQVDNLSDSLADASLIIQALAQASGLTTPRYKNAPKLKLHKQDNWKVAHDFMKQIGIVVRGIEPSDLADLHEAAIFNMFSGIMRWQTERQS